MQQCYPLSHHDTLMNLKFIAFCNKLAKNHISLTNKCTGLCTFVLHLSFSFYVNDKIAKLGNRNIVNIFIVPVLILLFFTF